MKLSYNWLKDYFENIPEPLILSEILTNLGLEVEDLSPYSSIPGNLENLIIGKVLSVIPHPNADRLKICQVDIGIENPLSIVCGAPNVAALQKVIVAPVGTQVHPISGEAFFIQKSKIRGEWSEGMLCAEDEIGLGKSHDGIKILPNDWKVGAFLKEYIHPYQDWIFEIGITPNRSDALSHQGAARDILAFLRKGGKTLVPKERFAYDKSNPVNIPTIQIEIQSDECLRFSGLNIQGIQVKESPNWLKNRLNSIGIRPINNIVDITNYICHDLGQPMHAYDSDSLIGSKIIARNAKVGESLITLDGQKRELSETDLIIADAKNPLGLAGVFGGQNSGIQEKTQNIFLESACFHSVPIRKTVRKFNLKTDASFRFERGTDPDGTIHALIHASHLILDLAGGQLGSDFLDLYPNPVKWPKVHLKKARLDSLIGKKIDKAEVDEILSGLGIKTLKKDQDSWDLEIPLYKVDVYREADIIEEILRVYGFNRIEIPHQLRSSIAPSIKPDPEKIQEELANFLAGRGFHETQSNSLISASWQDFIPREENLDPVMVLHPLSQDTNMLRPQMLSSILKAIEYNLNRKSNDLRFFEFGKVYFREGSQYIEKKKLVITWTGKRRTENWENNQNSNVNFFSIKGLIESLFLKLGLGFDWKETFHSAKFSEGLMGEIDGNAVLELGLVKSSLLKEFNIEKEVYYAELDWSYILEKKKPVQFKVREIPKFPKAQRDLSLILDQNIHFEQLKNAAFKAKIPILEEVQIVDVYEGNRIPKGKKSYSLRFFLQDLTRTLTDEEIDKSMKKILGMYQKEFGAEIPI